MKKIVLCGAAIMAIGCSSDKIAYVDNVALMEGFDANVAIESDYTTKSEALNKRRDSISQAFQAEYQAFQGKAANMSQQQAQDESNQLQQRAQFVGQQLQQEQQMMQMEAQVKMDSLITLVRDEIEAYGKANGYTFILSGGESGGVLYGAESKDVTASLIEVLNNKHPQE